MMYFLVFAIHIWPFSFVIIGFLRGNKGNCPSSLWVERPSLTHYGSTSIMCKRRPLLSKHLGKICINTLYLLFGAFDNLYQLQKGLSNYFSISTCKHEKHKVGDYSNIINRINHIIWPIKKIVLWFYYAIFLQALAPMHIYWLKANFLFQNQHKLEYTSSKTYFASHYYKMICTYKTLFRMPNSNVLSPIPTLV